MTDEQAEIKQLRAIQEDLSKRVAGLRNDGISLVTKLALTDVENKRLREALEGAHITIWYGGLYNETDYPEMLSAEKIIGGILEVAAGRHLL